jgi:hypothetical protein
MFLFHSPLRFLCYAASVPVQEGALSTVFNENRNRRSSPLPVTDGKRHGRSGVESPAYRLSAHVSGGTAPETADVPVCDAGPEKLVLSAGCAQRQQGAEPAQPPGPRPFRDANAEGSRRRDNPPKRGPCRARWANDELQGPKSPGAGGRFSGNPIGSPSPASAASPGAAPFVRMAGTGLPHRPLLSRTGHKASLAEFPFRR